MSGRVRFPAGGDTSIEGTIAIPKRARGLVVLVRAGAEAASSSAVDPVPRVLGRAGLGTLRVALLTPAEARSGPVDEALELELLLHRLERVTRAVMHDPQTHHLPVGYLGEALGASVAVAAAARHPRSIRAVVAWGGALAVEREALEHVLAPTLLVVDGGDPFAVARATEAFRSLRAEKRLEILRAAAGRPEAARTVAELAAGWFVAHLAMAEHAPADDVGGWIG